jgi:cell division protein ZapA
MPSTEVYILGQKYTIKGEASEEHINRLAGYIEGQLRDILEKFPNTTQTRALVLALFNTADEVHRLRAEQEVMSRHIEETASLFTGLFEGG